MLKTNTAIGYTEKLFAGMGPALQNISNSQMPKLQKQVVAGFRYFKSAALWQIFKRQT